MKTTILALLSCAAACSAQGLAPVAFLAGAFEGTGRHAGGEYRETLTGAFELGRDLLVIRSRSTMGGTVVFEDLRVLSCDGPKIRMRQWADGGLAEYDVVVGDADKTVVCTEVAHEGQPRPPWRYTFERDGTGFKYRVEQKEGADFQPLVAGALAPKTPDPREKGAHAHKVERTEIAGLAVELHVPEGDGPFPGVVFSPGGDAETVEGYAPFARWFASHGIATAIVAFAEEDAAARAALFAKVARALPKSFDPKRLAAAGHSSGGRAALLAVAKGAPFTACLALAPSGPEAPPAGPPTLVVVGTADELHDGAVASFEALAKPRYCVAIDGMDHMFSPPDAGMEVLARATSFLLLHLCADARYRELLLAPRDGVRVTSAM